MVEEINSLDEQEQDIITYDHVKKLAERLKSLNSKWVLDMAKMMYSQSKDYEIGKAKTKIYNITNNVTRAQDVRARFAEVGLALISEYEGSMRDIKQRVDSLD